MSSFQQQRRPTRHTKKQDISILISVSLYLQPIKEENINQQNCPLKRPNGRYSSCCQVASVVSDSVRPHRRQPTRLPCPWDSPGKNTQVGCYLLFQCMKVKSESEVTQSCPTLWDPMDCSPPGSSVHGIFQSTGMGCYCLLQMRSPQSSNS